MDRFANRPSNARTASGEPLQPIAWDRARALATIERIARDTEARFSPDTYWPIHPLDADGGPRRPLYPLYHGACGVIWALHYLEAAGAVSLTRSYKSSVEGLLPLTREWLGPFASTGAASYLMGETGILLLNYWLDPREDAATQLEN